MSTTASVTMHMMMLKRLSSSVQTISVKSPLRRGLSQTTTTSRIPFELLVCNLATDTHGGASLPLRRRSLHVRATQVNEPGSIDSPLMQSMQKKIKEQLNADVVIVQDANGDGRHVSIDVVASAFEGQSAVNRQRMVYKAIWEELQTTVHAVDTMTTKTPNEVNNNNNI